MARTTVRLVRYISPFGTPAWMPRETAEKHLADDDRRWLLHQSAGNLSEYQLAIGPPRIETGVK
jgi:hypothetical protein